MTVLSPHFGKFVLRVAFASALALPGARLAAETAEPPGGGAGSDPSKRLEWLKAHAPAVAVAPKLPAPKVKFRANPVAPSPVATQPAPAESRPAEARPAKPSPAEPPPTRTPSGESRIAKVAPPAPPRPTPVAVVAAPAPGNARTAEARSTPAAKSKPAPIVTATPAPESRVAKATPSAPAKATPPVLAKATPPAIAPAASQAKVRTAEAVATPAAKAKTAPPAPAKPTPAAVAVAPTPARVRTAEARSTPLPKATPAPVVAAIQPARPQPAKGLRFGSARNVPDNRYPWKTDIVTTIFWIGEPVGGHNLVPNFASSWDSHWTQAYGGFDTPDTAARRNFIPVKFVPRQNPFYIALPYNDVTRGTTKPEARLVIPWFKEDFEREGESVCRDRWVAIRNRAGRVAYAQWSDCGPFRTDHWQYVFGNEKPKPNLNKGAGLDVSPAVRDYLGLGSTDVTDWKFVDTKDVPGGPWTLYGDNNQLVRRGTQSPNNTAKQNNRPVPNAPPVRVSTL